MIRQLPRGLQNRKKGEWWQQYFDANYLRLYVDICSPLATKRQIDFLTKNLNLKNNTRVLDLGCGYGRHTIALAGKGCRVTGLDYSNYLLAIAKKEAARQAAKVNFVQGDMRHMAFRNKFEVVISMFTSFGYFDNYRDNQMVIRNISQALVPKGKFLVDLNNPIKTLSPFIRKSKIDRKTDRFIRWEKKTLSNGLIVRIKSELDPKMMSLFITRYWQESKQMISNTARVNLFTFPELNYILENNGFCVLKMWGDYDGSVFRSQSRRMIVLAEKITGEKDLRNRFGV